jgi:hypothetical protein
MDDDDLLTDDELEAKFTTTELIHTNDPLVSDNPPPEIDSTKFRKTFSDMYIPKGYVVVSTKSKPKVIYNKDGSILEEPIFFNNTEYLGQVTYYPDVNDYFNNLYKFANRTLRSSISSPNLFNHSIYDDPLTYSYRYDNLDDTLDSKLKDKLDDKFTDTIVDRSTDDNDIRFDKNKINETYRINRFDRYRNSSFNHINIDIPVIQDEENITCCCKIKCTLGKIYYGLCVVMIIICISLVIYGTTRNKS